MSRARVSKRPQWGSFSRRFGLLSCVVLSCLTPANAQNQQGIEELRARAEEAYEAGRLLDALADYERLVSLFPEEGCLHGRLAGCALREPGRLTLARRHLRIAIKLGCPEVDVEFHRARLAQLEYDFDRARDLYAAYLAAAGKKARFKEEARIGSSMCSAVIWDPTEAIGLDVLDRFPADPDGAFRFYRPQTPGIRLVNTPKALRSKADNKTEPGRIAFHNGDTVLVYASLGKSGKTGWDLYQISLVGGEYGEAHRLSDSVNSVYDERGAYLSKDGVLYFSSNRPGGLGGQDIYAVKWGLEGPVGSPERLPFPVNSVNDDEFFIPEPDGGAWMSSNRAAREGRIHAYRVALSDALFDAGSVSWLADEVASDGMTLRVYSNGEEISVRKLDGEGAEFQSILSEESAVGVRIVLEDRDGQIVSESFGAADSSWELRKQGRGWTMVERGDVDWAMLADLRSQDGPRVPQDAATEAEAESLTLGANVQGWGDWVSNRIDSSVLADWTSSAEPLALGGNVKSVAPETEGMSSAEGGVEEGAGLEGGNVPAAQDVLSMEGELEEEETAAEDTMGPRTVSALLLEGEAPTTEELRVIMEEEPEALAAVWNEKAQKLLVQESNFLDAPSMARAGMLSDLVEGLSEWSPDSDLMAPEVRDGAALGEVDEMIEAWTYAVQSATKASLANVAGDAALAYRRERLALREIEAMGSGNLSEAIGALSDWQSQQGDEVVVTEIDASNAEVGAWLEIWEQGLKGAELGWSRKQRSGWRGDWLKRQRRHMEVVTEQWELLLQEMSQGALVGEFESPDGVEEGLISEGQGQVLFDDDGSAGSDSVDDSGAAEESSGSVAVDMEFLEVPFGRNSSETLVRFVLGRSMTEAGEGGLDLSGAGVQDLDALMQVWEESILNSRKVEKAWERMVDRNGGRGIPLVMGAADFETLDTEVGQELLDLKQSMLELLSESVVALRASQTAVAIEMGDEELLVEGEAQSAVQAQMASRKEDWERAQSNTDSLGTAASKFRGVERFEAQVQWHEALVRESGFRSAYQESLLSVQDELRRLDEERLRVERIEAERIAMAEKEAERIEAERIEAERIAIAEKEAERREAERVEFERLETERIEADRLEAEWIAIAEQEDDQVDVQVSEDEGLGVELVEGNGNGEEAVLPGLSSGPVPVLGLNEEALSDAIGAGLPVDWTLEKGSGILDASLVYAPNAEQEGGGAGWSDEEWRLIQSWAAWRGALSPTGLLGENIKRDSDRDKDRFFATRDVQRALAEVDLTLFERRLQERREEAVSLEADLQEALVDNLGEEDGNEVAGNLPASGNATEDSGDANATVGTVTVDPIGEAVSLRFGVTLPEAEVVGEGVARNSGIRLRPIQREVLEKAILGSKAAAESIAEESAEEMFARPDGRPKADGVEYKIQVGAFRKALPAALFSIFDPMWAQRLANGITRYLAGSFDAYDSAVEARDAIRDLGYSDAFVVRFVSGKRVRAARPDTEELALERDQIASVDVARMNPSDQSSPVAVDGRPVLTDSDRALRNEAAPEVPEDIPTWSNVQGRVYSVQVGAFRGVPDAKSLKVLGTLTREDSGSDGWLRLFSGRFDSEQEAIDHRNELRSAGRGDAFVVVYINGRRIPLAQASTTAVAGIANMSPEVVAQDEPEAKITAPLPSLGWWVELGRFESTIPVRLANAILDAPLNWDIKSDRQGVQTVYLTRSVDSELEALRWMEEAKRRGFSEAKVLNQGD